MDRRALAFATLLAVVIVSATCGCLNPGGSGSLPADKYVAVKETVYVSGKIVDGNYFYHVMAEPPAVFTYLGAQFSGIDGVAVNDSLKLLYGIIHVNDTDIAWTDQLSVSGIYEFPYRTESGPIIEGVDKSGTVLMSFDNESVRLAAGEAWSNSSSDDMLRTLDVTDYSWVDAASGNTVTLTFNNETIVYKNVTSFSSYVSKTLQWKGTNSTYTEPATDTTVPPEAVMRPEYHYTMRLNFSYRIDNLGIYDKSVIS